jgi:PIN domain nuclease of toxin-antitoxin system
MPEITATDTHALIWYAQEKWSLLGRQARRCFERADEGKGIIYVPTLCLVELSEAARAGALTLPGGFDAWTQGLLRSRRFIPVDLTVEIVTRSHSLFAIPERGDRLIAATAMDLDVPLITRDPEIAASGVAVIW